MRMRLGRCNIETRGVKRAPEGDGWAGQEGEGADLLEMRNGSWNWGSVVMNGQGICVLEHGRMVSSGVGEIREPYIELNNT